MWPSPSCSAACGFSWSAGPQSSSPAGNRYLKDTVEVQRGWRITSLRLLDIWGRWDSGWYFTIINEGYFTSGDVVTSQSNVIFFPLYPMTVRFLRGLLPGVWQNDATTLLVGVLVSNICCLAALVLLYQVVQSLFPGRQVAQRTILYLLVFPMSFFFSCFYTESLFLLLTVAAFWAAQRRAWALAAVCGALAALTRPLGVLIVIPLLWLYVESTGRDLRRVWPGVAWFALIPAAFAGYFLFVYHLTGNPLGPLVAQQAFDGTFTWPWQTFLHPRWWFRYITPFEQALMLVFIALCVLALRRLPSPAYGIYALLLLLPPLTDGTMASTARFDLVLFPCFIAMALLTAQRPTLHRAYLVGAFVLLTFYMALWSQFYWVG